MKKNIAAIAFLIALSLAALTACGKSEDEKAAEEIYNNLDADEQQAVDKARQEIADYEAEKQNGNGETDGIDYMATLTEWELGKDIVYNYSREASRDPAHIDFGQTLFIYYPAPQYTTFNELNPWYVVGDTSHPLYDVTCYTEDLTKWGLRNEEIYEKNEKIGNYKVLIYTGTVGEKSQSATITVYNELTKYTTCIEFYGQGKDIGELINKNWDYIIEQVKAFPAAEAVEIPYGVYMSESGVKATVEDMDKETSIIVTYTDDKWDYYSVSYRADGTLKLTEQHGDDEAGTLSSDGSSITITGTEKADGTYIGQAAPPVRGQVPYGYYVCDNGGEANIILSEDNSAVINIVLNGEELTKDLGYIGSSTYSLSEKDEIASTFAIAQFDENWDMNIVAEKEEAKPFEGLYTLVKLEQTRAFSKEETDTADDDIQAQGEIPYGRYVCSEAGTYADISLYDGIADVIEFSYSDSQRTGELMTDFTWAEGNTYNMVLGSTLATGTFDESGNMQVTALSDEAKPFEGYYVLQ